MDVGSTYPDRGNVVDLLLITNDRLLLFFKKMVCTTGQLKCFGYRLTPVLVTLEIPADGPDLSTKSSFSDLTSLEAIALSRQRGFAGITKFNNVSTCQWHRYIDYQPFSGKRDIGSLHWQGDTLIEFGVEETYKEWHVIYGMIVIRKQEVNVANLEHSSL